MTDTLTPVLTANWDQPDSFTLAGYTRTGGYKALPRALAMAPDDVIAAVKAGSLRGRGGAGFPTGMKWSFIPQNDGKPHYLTVNADESEPGTCKDVPLMMANPHVLIEGAIITCYAIRASHAFIYVRGEVLHTIRRLQLAAAQAYEAGYLGKNILGSGFDLELIVHAGAGAYICGEETALLTSLEGYRGLPRNRPPFPAVEGLYASPTVINNVESIASVPSIIGNGSAWFSGLGTERSKGFGIFSLSGHVKTPGQYEAPLGIEGVGAAGSMLGTRALQIFDDTTCVLRAALRWTEFYQHESCGKCTPCREGAYWMVRTLQRLEDGKGIDEDIETILDVGDNIMGRAFCALGDAVPVPITSALKYFRDEIIQHQKQGGCPFDPAASTVWAV